MQESGYKTGTNQLGRDAVSISSLYPGNLGVIAQGYDGSRDSTALSYQGECFFTQPPLASREDTLKFVASSAAKATGLKLRLDKNIMHSSTRILSMESMDFPSVIQKRFSI